MNPIRKCAGLVFCFRCQGRGIRTFLNDPDRRGPLNEQWSQGSRTNPGRASPTEAEHANVGCRQDTASIKTLYCVKRKLTLKVTEVDTFNPELGKVMSEDIVSTTLWMLARGVYVDSFFERDADFGLPTTRPRRRNERARPSSQRGRDRPTIPTWH